MEAQVRPLRLPFDWEIASTSREGICHLVAIDAYNGNGSCTCENFEYRLLALVKQGQPARCQHIKAAREAFADLMINKLSTNPHTKRQ